KGFSVVASEVKQLAQQTARATEEIQAQVQAVQTQTSGAVEAIMGIGGTIRDLNALAAAVAAAVEEQGAATKEIAQNVEQAALGMATVSDTIQQVVRLAQSTGGSASAMLSSAEGLGVQSGRLSQSIDSFVGRLKRQA
ncbi:MAG: methyl-accepting chemotaxis protein, partial [Elsteraceae bacterium]